MPNVNGSGFFQVVKCACGQEAMWLKSWLGGEARVSEGKGPLGTQRCVVFVSSPRNMRFVQAVGLEPEPLE